MKLIVGLGNPGKTYERNRHNVGFRVLDWLARHWQIDLSQRTFGGRFGSGRWANEQVLLLKPQTYMNRSGESVATVVGFYRLALEDVLVVMDDIALPLGQLRLRGQGSAGGHNGLRNSVEHLGRSDIPRLRIGIGEPGFGQAVGHVLGDFSREEEAVIDAAVAAAGEAVTCYVEQGLERAMTRYNGRPDRQANGPDGNGEQT